MSNTNIQNTNTETPAAKAANPQASQQQQGNPPEKPQKVENLPPCPPFLSDSDLDW